MKALLEFIAAFRVSFSQFSSPSAEKEAEKMPIFCRGKHLIQKPLIYISEKQMKTDLTLLN